MRRVDEVHENRGCIDERQVVVGDQVFWYCYRVYCHIVTYPISASTS